MLYNTKTNAAKSRSKRYESRIVNKMHNKMNIQYHNSYLEVNVRKLRENARTIIRGLTEGTELIPVLKDDAYGLGLTEVAGALAAIPEIRTFAVSHVSEGLELRASGTDREILVMGGALPFQTEAAVQAELTLACGHSGMLTDLAEAARRCGKKARVQIKIDTGLHRIGFEPERMDEVLQELRRCGDEICVTGVFSHFSDIADAALDRKEYALFRAAVSRLEEGGLAVPMCHMGCSASSECHPEYNMDAVRCGRRLYMDHPSRSGGSIQEVCSWRSFMTQVSRRKAGEQIGYGGAVTLERDSLIATVGVGYGDGLNQELFRVHAPVLAGGKRCRMLACCMDQCMIDVTGLACQPGDEVTFFGFDSHGNFLSSQEVAGLVNSDEGCGLTSALSRRVARVYTEE